MSGDNMTPPKTHSTVAVDPATFASTYTTEQLITTLYLENQYLKEERAATFEVADLELPSIEEVATNEEYLVAQQYLDQTDEQGPHYLVLANDYPAVGAEYGNGFVHRRVKAYQELGANVDVIAFGRRREPCVYEYDGVRVLSGYGYELLGLLATRHYESISVHFLNPAMWNILYPARDRSRFVFFLHGYEVDRWIRRAIEHKNPKDLRQAISRSLTLQTFWGHVTKNMELQAKFVFVSEWWRRLVSEDMEVVIPEVRSSIIHNVIDTDLFSYQPKNPSQRYKILWIRSAGSRKYGSDLAVRCLETLRASAEWDKFDVRIIGDGVHFDEFYEAFGRDPRVTIERRFVPQEEIARLHKDYGVLLVPTRYDSQGVSRDEAMSSGLVPVTNAVAAVPEFVDDQCAILAGPEDAEGMAEGILRLANEPELFQRMSASAAARARRQCGPDATVAREAELLGMLKGKAQAW